MHTIRQVAFDGFGVYPKGDDLSFGGWFLFGAAFRSIRCPYSLGPSGLIVFGRFVHCIPGDSLLALVVHFFWLGACKSIRNEDDNIGFSSDTSL